MFTLTQRLPRPLLSVAIVSLDRHLACNISCGNVGFGCMLTVASGCHLRCGMTYFLGGEGSVVRAPDSCLKGRKFESLQERRENFLL